MITPKHDIVIAGRYTLVRPLAQGGMGSVWIAHHRDLEVDVTVKFMAPSLAADANARMRFEREAKVAASLRSQHVVQVHDYGVESDTPYIVMELLQGESLSARLKHGRRLELPDVVRLVVQICKALRTAHDAGLVHRDIKPGNIFLAHKDEDEVVKVLDFGIAKAQRGFGEAQASTEEGVILGSVHYMSPEQIRSSRTVDHRSDLWSVGVLAYRMLTGRLPFPGATQWEVLTLVCNDARPPPPAATPDLPARIDDFFERALARDLNRRFQSAPELAEAFSTMALTLADLGQVPSVVAKTAHMLARGIISNPLAEVVTKGSATWNAPTPEGKTRSALISGAEEPIIAASPTAESEITIGSIRAMLVSDPRAKQALQGGQLSAGKKSATGSASLIAALLTTVVALGLILSMSFHFRTASHSATANAMVTTSAPRAASKQGAPVPSTTITSPETTSPLATSPMVTAQGGGSTRAPTPLEKPRDILRVPPLPSAHEPWPPTSASPKPAKSKIGPLEGSF